MESNGLGHPLLPGGRAVWVDVHSLRHLWVGFSSYHPARVVELVAAVIGSDYVHQENILRFFIKTIDSHFKTGEHSPEREICQRGISSEGS